MPVLAPQRIPGTPLAVCLSAGGEPVVAGEHGRVRWREAGPLLFGEVRIDEASFGDDLPSRLMDATTSAYQDIFATLDARGFDTLARAWNYLPDINRETHGLERYRQFNAGRQVAFAASGRPLVGNVPAACALGTREGPLSIAFLAARGDFLPLENPRQVSAYHYPRDYGERSPTFSRAGILRLPGRELLFVSGTAAIVGHRSLHPDDVVAQTQETLANLRSVVAEAVQASPSMPASLEALDFTIYLRRAGDLETVCSVITESLGGLPRCVVVEADVCRSDLLVEIEATGESALESV
ncbi:MAG: hypothetical protein KDH20_13135 [Rhodocyclaceae bacterium]|nr:hypothetical protein [Rhodocyclaceae bacterium]